MNLLAGARIDHDASVERVREELLAACVAHFGSQLHNLRRVLRQR